LRQQKAPRKGFLHFNITIEKNFSVSSLIFFPGDANPPPSLHNPRLNRRGFLAKRSPGVKAGA
jgi:hypothetical protein